LALTLKTVFLFAFFLSQFDHGVDALIQLETHQNAEHIEVDQQH
jgi:hypothetical protein